VTTNLNGRAQQLNNTNEWAGVKSILLSHYTACPVKFLIDSYAFR
jgi:hypothetical protein